ncbi:MAG: sigma-70 family RNA polymerase sigma factor, partial [Clostridia bacterium]|nr:sigma-70 family RNA polymerase sigma factor [Clostridia bacterium]
MASSTLLQFNFIGIEVDGKPFLHPPDCFRDALIKAWEKRSSLRDMKQFKPWITRILMNQCKD